MAAGEEGAHDAALRALRHRDLSVRELEERLAARGHGESERKETVESLLRTGLLDDTRFAESRAGALAARGSGDALIRHELSRAGVELATTEHALGTIEPERVRARAIVERRGPGPKTARYLAGKGFSHDTVASVVAAAGERELG
jgi:regulatory protein